MRDNDLVDYWVVPDSKAKGSSHWAGPCRVIGRGGNGTTNKSWVICRPADGAPQEVARHRLRLHTVPHMIQLAAIDPSCSPELDAVRAASSKAAQSSDAPLDVDALPELEQFLASVRTRWARLGRVVRRKKKIIEDDDDAADAPRSMEAKESAAPSRTSQGTTDSASKPGQGVQVKSRSAERASSVPVPPERRSARLNKDAKTSPLREIVDHRLSRLQTAPQHGEVPSPGEGRASTVPPDGEMGSPEPDRFYDWLGGDVPTPRKDERLAPAGDEETGGQPVTSSQAQPAFAPNFGPARAPPPSLAPSSSKAVVVSMEDSPPAKVAFDPNIERDVDPKASSGEVDSSKVEPPTSQPPPDSSKAEVPSASQEDVDGDDVSEADTQVLDLADLVLPESFLTQDDPMDCQDPGLALWSSDLTTSETLMSTSDCEKFEQSFLDFRVCRHDGTRLPSLHALLTQKALKAGREVPRPEALQDELFWKAMEAEIDQLIENGVIFDAPSEDEFIYSSRWVFTYKEDGSRKARSFGGARLRGSQRPQRRRSGNRLSDAESSQSASHLIYRSCTQVEACKLGC